MLVMPYPVEYKSKPLCLFWLGSYAVVQYQTYRFPVTLAGVTPTEAKVVFAFDRGGKKKTVHRSYSINGIDFVTDPNGEIYLLDRDAAVRRLDAEALDRPRAVLTRLPDDNRPTKLRHRTSPQARTRNVNVTDIDRTLFTVNDRTLDAGQWVWAVAVHPDETTLAVAGDTHLFYFDLS
jgi:hypothetical protein